MHRLWVRTACVSGECTLVHGDANAESLCGCGLDLNRTHPRHVAPCCTIYRRDSHIRNRSQNTDGHTPLTHSSTRVPLGAAYSMMMNAEEWVLFCRKTRQALCPCCAYLL